MTHDHVHGPDCGHDHHAHDPREYYLEQLLTVGISGSFAVVAIMLYRGGNLKYVLVPELQPWVLGGGIALFLLTLVRVAALWQAAKPVPHDHHHAPGEVCDHDHGHAAPAGGHHDHDHGSIFWHVVVLMFPIALFVMGLPNEGFSQEYLAKRLGAADALGAMKDVADKGGDYQTFNFTDLANAATDPETRESLEGRRIRVKGQLQRISDKECTLFYQKMNCCAADMIPLKARIVAEDSLGNLKSRDFEWVIVAGKLQFAEVPGKNQFIPVVRTKVDQITPSTPE